jgi:ABC-type branched-subunit amino acid transport system substrate-binding protein
MRPTVVFTGFLAVLCATAACAPPYEGLPMTPSQSFAQAEDALRRGEYASAVTGFSEYLSSGQETFRARAFYELAQAQYGLENYDAALDTVNDLEADYPNRQWAQTAGLRGDIHYAMGRRVDAILDWQSAWERGNDTDRQFLRPRIEEAIDELTATESSRLAADLTNDDLRAMLSTSAAPGPSTATARLDEDEDEGVPPAPPARAEQTEPPPLAAVAAPPAPATGGVDLAAGEALAPGAKVACLLPLTGPDRAYGQRALSGLRLAFAGNGNTLMVRDSGGQSDVAAQLVNALADDPQVLALIGPLRTSTATTVAPLAERLQLPTLLLARADGLAGPYVLQTATTPDAQMRLLVDHAITKLQLRRFGVLYPDDAYGRSYMARFRDVANAAGATVVKINAYRPGTDNFAAQASAAKTWVESDGVQAIFIPDGAATATAVAAAARAVAPQVVLLGTESWNQPDVIAAAGAQIDGAIFADSFFAGSPSGVEFATRFRNQYGYEPSGYEAQAYDAGMLVRQALADGARSRGAVLQRVRELASVPSGPAAASAAARELVLLEVRDGHVGTVR